MIIIRQKEFANRDYEGLSEMQKDVLRKKRSDYAKALRNKIHEIDKNTSDIRQSWDSVNSKGHVTGGGVKSHYEFKTAQGNSRADFLKNYKNNARRALLDSSQSAKEVMKEDVKNLPIDNSSNARFKHLEREIDKKLHNDPLLTKPFKDRVESYKIDKQFKKIQEERAKRKEEKAAKEAAKKASKESIAKHEAKAAELRAKKEAAEKLKGNLKKGGIGALAIGGTVAAGYGAKKLYDKKKSKESEKK